MKEEEKYLLFFDALNTKQNSIDQFYLAPFFFGYNSQFTFLFKINFHKRMLNRSIKTYE